MQLIVCEKPKVAEKVARALSGGKYKKIRENEVNYYTFEKDGETIYVVSAVGHVYTLGEKNKHNWFKYPVFDVEWKPLYIVDKKAKYVKNYIDVIKKISKQANEIINSCDFDIEGSLIGYNVIRFACNADPSTAMRMKFSTLTKDELIKAYKNRFRLDLSNSYAGEARHTLDWFYGVNLSRALMSALRKNKVKKVLSIGRVQGPALALLVKREEEIKNFVPQPYWELHATVKGIDFIHEKGKFFDKQEIDDIEKKVKISPSIITEIKKTKKKILPPPPFDLTTLQVEAYNAFKISPSQTLNIAQTLYENSLISYPRTSSQKLPKTLGLKNILISLSKQKKYEPFVKKLLAENRTTPKEGKKDDPAHPAIHPTGIKPDDLSEKESKIYDMVVRRFLACFAPELIREGWKIVLMANNEKFIANGTHTVSEGWREYYPFSSLSENNLPEISKGEVIPKFKKVKKMTKPPKRYTQATLISELEKRKLGTKATRAVVVDTLFKRGYIQGKSIEVKPLGMAIYYALQPFCPEILDEKLTRHFESEMEKIQVEPPNKAKEIMNKVIEEGKVTVESISEKFKKHEIEIGKKLREAMIDEIVMGKCPLCGGNLVIRISRSTKKQFIGCENFPKCRMTYPLPQDVNVTFTGEICEYCGAPIVMITPKRGKSYRLCLNPECPSKKNKTDKTEKKQKENQKEKKGEKHENE